MHHLDYVPLVVEDGCKVRIMLMKMPSVSMFWLRMAFWTLVRKR